MKVQIELEKRKEIAKNLRWGDAALIAKLAGVTRQTVERYLRGEVSKSSIEPYIIKIAEQRKAELDAAFARAAMQTPQEA